MENFTHKETVTASLITDDTGFFVRHIYYPNEDNRRYTAFYAVNDENQANLLIDALNKLKEISKK